MPISPTEEHRTITGQQQSDPAPSRSRGWVSGLWIIPLGWELAVPIVAGAVLGHWLDNRYQSSPAWTILLLFLGTAAGFYNVWSLVRRAGQRDRHAGDSE